MARFSLLLLLATVLVAAGAKANESITQASVLGLDLDSDGQEIQFINSVYGDDDDDDYTAAELEQRAQLRESKHHHKHSKRHRSNKSYSVGPSDSDELWRNNMQISWYASHDLLNPQCGNGGGKWQPVNSCHIGAVVKNWDDGPQCGEFVKLCNPKAHNHCVRVRVIDKCASCGPGHVDLTKSAFKKLSPSGTLTEGRIHGLKMYRTKLPNPWDLALFGPRKLRV